MKKTKKGVLLRRKGSHVEKEKNREEDYRERERKGNSKAPDTSHRFLSSTSFVSLLNIYLFFPPSRIPQTLMSLTFVKNYYFFLSRVCLYVCVSGVIIYTSPSPPSPSPSLRLPFFSRPIHPGYQLEREKEREEKEEAETQYSFPYVS